MTFGKTCLRAAVCLAAMAALGSGAEKKGQSAFAFAFEDEGRILLNPTNAAKVEAPMVLTADKKASGGKCLLVPDGPGDKEINPGWDPTKEKEPTGKGFAVFKFNVPKDGKYYLWARANWHSGCANSVWVRFDGGTPHKLGDDGTYRRWHWVMFISRRHPTFRLKKGEHTLMIVNREDGTRIDQIILTPKGPKDYIPVGVEE